MKSYESLDWKLIASVDVNNVLQTLDYEPLQKLVENIAHCNIDSETDGTLNPSFLKLFKLSQCIIRYLLSSQECLLKEIQKISENLEEEKKIKLENKAEQRLRKKTELLKKELQQKEELVTSQSVLIKCLQSQQSQQNTNVSNRSKTDHRRSTTDHNSNLFRCRLCNKAYSTKQFLDSHLSRRHPASPHKNRPEKGEPRIPNPTDDKKLINSLQELESLRTSSWRSLSKLVQLQQQLQHLQSISSSDSVERDAGQQHAGCLKQQLNLVEDQMVAHKQLQQILEHAVLFVRQNCFDDDLSRAAVEQEQLLQLRRKLQEKEDDNLRLMQKLREVEEEMRSCKTKNVEINNQKKFEKMNKKQLEDEFEWKLELMKEEQNMEHKFQLERLQTSIMTEMKRMHLKQLETQRDLEDVRKLRIPGVCLGLLEDDHDSGGDDDSHQQHQSKAKKQQNLNKKYSGRLHEVQDKPAICDFPEKIEVEQPPALVQKKKTILKRPHRSPEPSKEIESKTSAAASAPPAKASATKEDILSTCSSIINLYDSTNSLTSDSCVDEFGRENVITLMSAEAAAASSLNEPISIQDLKEMVVKANEEFQERLIRYGIPQGLKRISNEKYSSVMQLIDREFNRLPLSQQEEHKKFKQMAVKKVHFLIPEGYTGERPKSKKYRNLYKNPHRRRMLKLKRSRPIKFLRKTLLRPKVNKNNTTGEEEEGDDDVSLTSVSNSDENSKMAAENTNSSTKRGRHDEEDDEEEDERGGGGSASSVQKKHSRETFKKVSVLDSSDRSTSGCLVSDGIAFLCILMLPGNNAK